jgi:DNA-directed RNA polymerase specialized sigma24 family protein
MSHHQSVTEWLAALKSERSIAAGRLWDRYVEKLARLARRRLRAFPRRVADEDDVVLEVFADFIRGVQQQRFQRLNDRHDLWQVLAMLTERKAIGLIRRESAAKRGQGRVHGESAFDGSSKRSGQAGIAHVVARDPDPQFAAELADLLGHLMKLLDDDLLRSLARDNLAGYTQQEMTKRHGISLPTVQRKLKLIAEKWQRGLPP